ncbi:MAG: hypothetical protein R6X34_21655 [Chloroflexota bacterium]
MTIQMQGAWTVSVKAKNAAFAQRFIISGAAVGNGVYAGNVGTPAVFANGDTWSITIQNKPGKSWVNSDDQIAFPTLVGSLVQFDVQSNDAGGDEDFDDLILTCATPQTATDFVVYGHVNCYSGLCIFNPCIRRFVVIETPAALQEALRNPLLKDVIKKLYPERIKPFEPPIPLPDPPPFRPLVLPLLGETAVPPRLGQEVRLADMRQAESEEAVPTLLAGRTVALANQPALTVAYDRLALADLVGKIRLRCHTESLPGFVIRFQEYDRTPSELSGGAYSGEGDRELLGLAVTDRNGNYIFRFTRSISEVVDEALTDTAAGEDATVQALPDVIAQLLDSTAPDGIAHETAPYWNTPAPLKRIDICIPCSKVRRPVTQCTGDYRFESVGRIRIGIPANVFDGDGRITAKDASANVPQARCAAWGGVLDLFGCLGDHTTVKFYTLRFRRYVSGSGWTSWQFYQEGLSLFKTSIMDTASVGPFDRNLEVVNGGPLQLVKAYDNVQGDFDWASSDWALRAIVNTTKSPFAGHIGPVEFRIQGYDASGNQVADPRISTIRLYLDNQAPDFDLDTVTIGSQADGDLCAVFTLSGEPVPAVLSVRFKVIQEQGFLNDYNLWVRKGNYPSFPIATTTGPSSAASAQLSNSYAHVSDTACAELVGTRFPDEPTAVADYATAYIIPASGDWLEGAETVCAFSVLLNCSKRVTNGYNSAVTNYGAIQKLLAIKKS